MEIIGCLATILIGGLFWSVVWPYCFKKVLELQNLNDNIGQFFIGVSFLVICSYSAVAITTQIYISLGLPITNKTWGVPGYIFLFLLSFIN